MYKKSRSSRRVLRKKTRRRTVRKVSKNKCNCDNCNCNICKEFQKNLKNNNKQCVDCTKMI